MEHCAAPLTARPQHHPSAERPAAALWAAWHWDLRRAVQSRVIPRLSDRERDGEGPAHEGEPAFEAEALRFCDLALTVGVPGLVARAEALGARGIAIDVVIERVMGPAARRLGDLWLSDRLSFLDVTAALGRLQGLLRALGPGLDAEAPADGRRILLAPAPGEQHVFGASVVAAFFRRAGWEVTFEPRAAIDDLVALVRAEPFAAVGLSAACDRFAAALPAQVEALRRASLDPDVVVLAGGPAFGANPGLRHALGVDAVALDAAEAVRIAGALSSRTAGARACS